MGNHYYMPLKFLLLSLFIISCNNIVKENRKLNIYYESDTQIGGFQFDIEGVDVIDISDGAAGTASFTLSTANNKVLGFSISGTTILPGDGILIILDVKGSGNACILDNGLIISDPNGIELSSVVLDCNTIHIP